MQSVLDHYFKRQYTSKKKIKKALQKRLGKENAEKVLKLYAMS